MRFYEPWTQFSGKMILGLSRNESDGVKEEQLLEGKVDSKLLYISFVLLISLCPDISLHQYQS